MTLGASSTHSGPRGLGGLLWLFGWPLAALPAVLVPMLAYRLYRAQQDLPDLAQRQENPSAWLAGFSAEMLCVVAFVALLVVSAEYFFRRSARFPALWAALMASLCLSAVAGQLVLRFFYGQDILSAGDLVNAIVGSLLKTWSAFLIAAVSLLYLHRSRRSRNTFGADMPLAPSSNDRIVSALLDGPRDWHHGVWMLPGYLLFALIAHTLFIHDLSSDALRPLGPPLPKTNILGFPPVNGREWILTARIRLGIHVTALVLVPVAAHLFVERARRFRWIFVALLLLAIASPATDLIVDPPSAMLDGPDTRAETQMATLVAGLLIPYLLLSSRVRSLFVR